MRRRKKTQIGSYAEARKKRESQTAYLMLCPALAGFLIFIGVPILALFILSFMKYDIISAPIFCGLRNIKHFFNDHTLPKVYFNTFKFAVFLIPLHICWGMLLAYCVSRMNRKVQYLCRTIIYFSGDCDDSFRSNCLGLYV